MKKKIILSVIACLLGTSLMFAHPAMVQQGNGKEQQDVHHYKKEVKHDHKEINKDKAQRNKDLRHHKGKAAIKEQHDIHHYKKDIKHDKHDEHK